MGANQHPPLEQADQIIHDATPPRASVVAISAKMHIGKTTLADLLVERGGYVRASFAASLKEFVQSMGLPMTREVMQNAGANARGILGEKVWVQAFTNRYGNLPRIVVDDMRYPNEYDFLMTNNAHFIRLEGGRGTQWERYLTSSKFDPNILTDVWEASLDHETENKLDDGYHWDSIIGTDNISAEQVFEQVLAHNPGILD